MQSLSTLGLKTLGLQTLGQKPNSQQTHKPAVKKYAEGSVVEQLQGIGTGVIDSVQADLLKPAPDILAQQVAGVELKKSNSHGGDMKPGQEISLSHGGDDHSKSDHDEEKSGGHHATTELGHHLTSEIVNAGEHAAKHEAHEMEQETHALISEIAQAAHGNEEAESIVANAEQHQTEGNIQTLNWARRFLKGLNEHVDAGSSASWMGAVKDKSSYWMQAKTKGTSFTQSGERNVATSVG